MIDQDLQNAIEKDRDNYFDHDPEDRRQITLADHLGEDPEDLRLSSHTDHLYILGGSMRRSGSSPAHYRKLAGEIREILSENNYLENTWQEVIDLFTDDHEKLIQSKLESDINRTDWRGVDIPEDQRREFFLDIHGNTLGHVAYATLSKLMPTDSPKSDPHRWVNGLYFLLAGPTKDDHRTYHYDAIRSAFNGEEIQDTRPIYPSDGGQYLVLTDSESDRLVTEYIRDSVELFMPGFLASETGIPEDAFIGLAERGDNAGVLRIIEKTCGLDDFICSAIGADGRGHFLAEYDGNETEILDDVSGEIYYIYRFN